MPSPRDSASFDHVHLVGLVETDWPERPRRSIFYTSGLLKALGWPQEADQTRAQQAAFRDLLRLPARTRRAARLPARGRRDRRPLADGRRSRAICTASRSDGRGRGRAVRRRGADVRRRDDRAASTRRRPRGWRCARRARRSPSRRYSGFVDARPPQPYRVSRVDRYVDCPFKYFAESVLGLPEEREEVAGLTPLERGIARARRCSSGSIASGSARADGTITPATLPDALRAVPRDRRRRARRAAGGRSRARGDATARLDRRAAAWPSASSSSRPTRAARSSIASSSCRCAGRSASRVLGGLDQTDDRDPRQGRSHRRVRRRHRCA